MYTYGRPQFLAQIITVNSFNSWKGEHTEDLKSQIKNNKKKLTGYYVANLWLGNGAMFDFKHTWKGIDFAIKKLIAACYCDYMAVKTAFATFLEEPEADKIRRDINELIFNRYNGQAFDGYKAYFDKSYEYIIKNVRDLVVNNWNKTEPCEEIKNFFNDSYTFKKRNRKSKYDWMKEMTVIEIAKKLISQGIDKLTNALISAMKHLHISVKNVIEALENIIDSMGNEAKERIVETKIKHEWFTSLSDAQKNSVCNYVKQAGKNEWDFFNLKITLMRCFNAPECIFKCVGRYLWGPTVGEYYNNLYNT